MAHLLAHVGKDKEIVAEIDEKNICKHTIINNSPDVNPTNDQKKRQDSLSIQLGILRYNEEAKITLTLVLEASLFGGAYGFSLPTCFFPQYKNHV